MNNRNTKRRVSCIEDQECSQQSIVSAMDRFVVAVNNMEETVLVPSRLIDVSAEGDICNNGQIIVPQAVMSGTDLHGFYNILNNVKTELLWGAGDSKQHQPVQVQESAFSQVPSTNRRKSISKQSVPDLCYDSDCSLDSLISECQTEDPSAEIAANFRKHLAGLFHTLQQLAEVSDYLTVRYQQEVGLTS